MKILRNYKLYFLSASSKINYERLWIPILVIISTFFLYGKMPIFPDEITNNYLSTVASSFDGKSVSLIESCNTNKSTEPYLVHILKVTVGSVYTNIQTLQQLRYLSLAFAGLVFSYIWIGILRHNNNRYLYLGLLLWPLVYVPLFVFCRPEIFILLCITSLATLNLNPKSKLANMHLCVGFFSYLIALNYHPKAIYFLPLILYSVYTCCSKRISIILITTLFFANVTYYNYYVESWLTCSHEYIADIVSKYQVSPKLFFTEPAEFLSRVLKSNSLQISDRAVSQLLIRNSYDIGYLPNIVTNQSLWNFFNAAFLIGFVFLVIDGVRSNISIFRIILLLTLIATYLMNANKAPYDMSLYVSIIVIFAALKHEPSA